MLLCAALALISCAPVAAPQQPTATPPMSLAEAQQIALQSDCMQVGRLKDTAVYNPNSNTWWIDLDATARGCNPACVVDVATKTAEVNWRCTGGATPAQLITPTPSQMANPASENCVKQGGTVSIQQNSDGSQYGLCVFPDGKQCEEWAMLNGDCPAGGIPVTGRYTAQLPAADAIGRVLVLELLPDSTGTLTTQYIGKGEPIVDTGTWAQPGKDIVVTIDAPASDQQTLTFEYDNGTLVLQNPAEAGYGSGLTLTRTPLGNTINAEYNGVKIAFDVELAQSAQGENIAAAPAVEGPALGGGTPAAIRFLFDGAKAEDYFNPHLAQVLVYKAEDWINLDPSTAATVANLKTLLATKPVSMTGSLPVLPPITGMQRFYAQAQYLDFQNGTGVGFLTTYGLDVSPVTADQLFYTFQGLTNDGKYYVAAFHPISTTLLPAQPAPMSGTEYDEFAQNYETYITTLTAQLNELISAGYVPDLVLVEDLMRSIEIADTTLQ
jgi:putative hemolysin